MGERVSEQGNLLREGGEHHILSDCCGLLLIFRPFFLKELEAINLGYIALLLLVLNDVLV